jgi:uncharacterized protein (UPF0548 family)
MVTADTVRERRHSKADVCLAGQGREWRGWEGVMRSVALGTGSMQHGQRESPRTIVDGAIAIGIVTHLANRTKVSTRHVESE